MMKKFHILEKMRTQKTDNALLVATPDNPIPFGYKTEWLCVKAQKPEEVIKVLGLTNPQPANWESGYRAVAEGKVFVSPVIDGYILVRGYGENGNPLPEQIQELSKLGKSFSQVQYYASHRVVDYAVWAKIEDGEVVRAYGWCGCDGEVLINEGKVTPQEEQIGMGNPLTDPLGEEDWDAFDTPDEESVIELAALWGIDPLFRGEYPKSAGFVCHK